MKFFSLFIRKHQELIEVNYFSAIPKDKGKQDRQDLLFSANKLSPKFNLILGKYFRKKIFHKGKVIETFEEKQSDVNIAVKMIRDIVLDNCDISIMVSADSDLAPPIDFIREYKPLHKIIVYFPPARFSYDLQNKANNSIKLQYHKQKFESLMLPEEVTLPNGYVIKRPKNWN